MYNVYPQYLMPQQPQMQQQQVQQPIMQMRGRPVGSLEEVKAAQIDLDGSVAYYPCPAENCIFTKSINLNGLPEVKKYNLSNEQLDKPKIYATQETVDKINQKIMGIEKALNIGGDNNENEHVNNANNDQ